MNPDSSYTAIKYWTAIQAFLWHIYLIVEQAPCSSVLLLKYTNCVLRDNLTNKIQSTKWFKLVSPALQIIERRIKSVPEMVATSFCQLFSVLQNEVTLTWPCGAMDNASAYGAEDSRFDPWQGRASHFSIALKVDPYVTWIFLIMYIEKSIIQLSEISEGQTSMPQCIVKKKNVRFGGFLCQSETHDWPTQRLFRLIL